MEYPSYIVNDYSCEKTLCFHTISLLSCHVHCPQIYKEGQTCFDHIYSTKKINTFYQEKSSSIEKNCKDSLFPMALKQYLKSKQKGYPFFPYEVISNFKVTLVQNNLFSLYQDLYTFTGGAHGNTVRSSETWNLTTQRQVSLADFFPEKKKEEVNQLFTSFIIHKISLEQKEEENSNYYFEDYKKNVMEYFNENNFFLTPDGIVIYFQQYEIAPYSSGIPEFLIPFK